MSFDVLTGHGVERKGNAGSVEDADCRRSLDSLTVSQSPCGRLTDAKLLPLGADDLLRFFEVTRLNEQFSVARDGAWKNNTVTQTARGIDAFTNQDAVILGPRPDLQLSIHISPLLEGVLCRCVRLHAESDANFRYNVDTITLVGPLFERLIRA